jgi:hypothetical protein
MLTQPRIRVVNGRRSASGRGVRLAAGNDNSMPHRLGSCLASSSPACLALESLRSLRNLPGTSASICKRRDPFSGGPRVPLSVHSPALATQPRPSRRCVHRALTSSRACPSLRGRRPCACAARYAEARKRDTSGFAPNTPGACDRPLSSGDDGIIALALCADLGRQSLERPTRWPRSWPGSPPRSTPAYSGLGLPHDHQNSVPPTPPTRSDQNAIWRWWVRPVVTPRNS